MECWVIASKNVAMLCRDKRDIDDYYGRRFDYAKLFGRAWFRKIKSMSKEKVKSLKKFLSNKTIIGEYCGD